MVEIFYIKVDITSDEDLEYYKDTDEGEVEYKAGPNERKKFNSEVEKAIKKVLIENVDQIEEYLDDVEGVNIEKQEAIERIAADFYDDETDLTEVTEMMTPGIKFTVVKRINKNG